MTGRTPSVTRLRTTVAHLHGCNLDEDMWDRVAEHWRTSEATPAQFTERLARVRVALCQQSLELHLVLDGPRLLSVTPVAADAGQRHP